MKIIVFTVVLMASVSSSNGQQVPLYPFSYRVFNPAIFNPAITGSKEYTAFGLITRIEENANSLLISTDTRLTRPVPGYLPAENLRDFTNLGLGGSIFNDVKGPVKNTGAMISAAYHIPINHSRLSFISVGASVKGVLNRMEDTSSDSLVSGMDYQQFYPGFDLGVYYYNSNFYAGFSAANIQGSPVSSENPDTYSVPVSMHYYFTTGYKILLSRAWQIVLEPTLLAEVSDTVARIDMDVIHPGLKIYLSDFCVGTYYYDNTRVPFFLQYRFPRFFLGLWVEVPLKTAFYLDQPVIELTAGFNLGNKGMRNSYRNRW